MKGKRSARAALKSKKSAKGDREQRMQKVLEESETAEEALMKRAAHFNWLDIDISDSKQNQDTCSALIDVRERQLQECEAQLLHSIERAMRQRIRILDLQPGWIGEKESGKGEVEDRLSLFLDDVSLKQSISGGADDEVHSEKSL